MLLQKLTKVLVSEETTENYGKASNEDFTSDNATANLVAGTPSIDASIVKVVSGNLGTGGILDHLYLFNGDVDEASVDLTAETYTDLTRWKDLGLAWAGTDAVLLQDSSAMTATVESLERTNINGSYVDCPSLSGAESSSGNLDLEASIKDIVGTEKGQFAGHTIVKSSLGTYVQGGANVSGNTITETAQDASDYDLYRLAKIGESFSSLAVRVSKGGSVDNVIDFAGVRAESLSMPITAGQLVNMSFTMTGGQFFPRDGQTDIGTLSCGNDPFVAKKVVFNVDGTEVKVSDITLTVGNTLNPRAYVQDNGTSESVVTGKSSEISFTEDSVTLDNLKGFKANTAKSLFVKLVNANGSEINVFYPNLRYSEVSGSSDAGVLTDSITLQAFNDVSGNAVYIGTKR